MITLHHLNNSRSQRIIWLLEELGVDYTIKHYERDAKTSLAPASLKAIHPLGKSPVITDGDQTIAESGLIIEYLIRTYGKERFLPEEGSATYWQYLYWLHYAEGSLMPLMVMSLIFNKIKTAPMPFFIKPIARGIADKVMQSYVGPNVQNNLRYIEQHLGSNSWFAGEQMTGADFQLIFPLEAALNRGSQASEYPNIAAWVKRVHALPTYQTALEKGGPYDYA
ncbi:MULTISPECIES: glutathione S-transferase [unclassified Thalassolituus]|jgi:glutathione S-transferase|uniref:glutathione S-transferase n=1 Tax=Oceanospirillaceae TaxID=135620 RepID=UPI000C36AB09|nr:MULTISPECIES: glutathione S-transferase [unclassified Thalassolituus]MCA6058401.1 glutathione S-transferase [Thalassolituus sp. ST750PaO-4]PIQ42178.1 MAG: glutathione S-transferase [Thalassolituus sp. CG17_big_fil_post_rev_8_21_14_2_50_53_8]TVV42153.1 glutathione S-transferase [Thalassolituus sp. C2-1]